MLFLNLIKGIDVRRVNKEILLGLRVKNNIRQVIFQKWNWNDLDLAKRVSRCTFTLFVSAVRMDMGVSHTLNLLEMP